MTRLLERIQGWSFRRKIQLLPAIAAASLVLILLMLVVTGTISERRLPTIEEGYYPSVQLSRTLETSLSQMQRGLQDAVSSRDADRLSEVDSLRDGFLRLIESGRTNPVIRSQRLDSLRSDFERYFALARATTLELIQGTQQGDMLASLE